MKVSEYRREYAKFCAAREREKFYRHLGLAPRPRAESPFVIFADLFSLEAIENLKTELNDASAQFETEREAVRALLSAARLVRTRIEGEEAREEIVRCEEAARFAWDGEMVSAHAGAKFVAEESAPARRREIAARWLDAIQSCDDSRATRAAIFRATARSLGFNDYLALRLDASRAHLDTLVRLAREFLERTATLYRAHLAEWAAGESLSSTPGELTYADSLFFKRAAQMDARFRRSDLRALYAAAMRDLGIRADQQPNVQIDDVSSSGETVSKCFGIKPPEEVRLVAARRASANEIQNFLSGAGRAQAYAWTSPEMAARYPEFVYATDRATDRAHGFLFRALLQDEQWISEHFGFASRTAETTKSAFALLELYDARRCCARVSALRIAPDDDLSSEQAARDYARLMTEATNFHHSAGVHSIDWEARIESVDEMRARLFAAHLTEHLRTRHGRRWWAARKARDELIDMWNTGSRYPVEELAAHLTGARAFEVELLTHASVEALSGI